MRSIQKWAKPFVLMMTLAFALGAVGCSSDCEDCLEACNGLTGEELAVCNADCAGVCAAEALDEIL